jgi:hypothetical protein
MSKNEKLGLSVEDQKDVQQKLEVLKRKFKKTICKKCGDEIHFISDSSGRPFAYDADGTTPHWQSCPNSIYTQKKASMTIMRKLAALFLIKHGLDLEKEANLTKREVQIIQASLEYCLQKQTEFILPISKEDPRKVDGEISFKPDPCDCVGDPDEERAVSEEMVTKLEQEIAHENKPNKGEVEKAIESIIQEHD